MPEDSPQTRQVALFIQHVSPSRGAGQTMRLRTGLKIVIFLEEANSFYGEQPQKLKVLQASTVPPEHASSLVSSLGLHVFQAKMRILRSERRMQANTRLAAWP